MSRINKTAATVQPMTASKTNDQYLTTGSSSGATTSRELPNTACSRLGPSADVEGDIFDFAECDRQSRLADLRERALTRRNRLLNRVDSTECGVSQ